MPSKVKDLLRKPWRVAENRWLRLFIKNEAPVNGGRNYNGPKVAKFLVG